MKLINVYHVLSFLDEVYTSVECSYFWFWLLFMWFTPAEGYGDIL